MTHHEFWDENKREQELMAIDPTDIAIELPSPRVQEPDEPFMNYVVHVVDEKVGMPVLDHGLTNSTGMNMILKHILGWNQNQRGDFMRVLIANGLNEHITSPEAEKPYSISVTKTVLI